MIKNIELIFTKIWKFDEYIETWFEPKCRCNVCAIIYLLNFNKFYKAFNSFIVFGDLCHNMVSIQNQFDYIVETSYLNSVLAVATRVYENFILFFSSNLIRVKLHFCVFSFVYYLRLFSKMKKKSMTASAFVC